MHYLDVVLHCSKRRYIIIIIIIDRHIFIFMSIPMIIYVCMNVFLNFMCNVVYVRNINNVIIISSSSSIFIEVVIIVLVTYCIKKII